MIYLDVTSAASHSNHMGVHRMARGIYHYLTRRRPETLTPLRWDFGKKRYATLSSREMRFLTNTSDDSGDSKKKGKWTDLREAWIDNWTRHQRGIASDPFLLEKDSLLIPDLCWDARVHFWSRLSKWPGQKIAVFHDAMPLNVPGQANSNDKLFKTYVCALGHLDRIICISQEVRDDLLRYWDKFGIPEKPTMVLPWPVPFSQPRPKNQPNQHAQHLIYVARLKLRKNHLLLLDACERLWQQGQKFTLDFIGIEDAFLDTAKILNRVHKLAARGCPVRWRKYISDDELAEAYQDCSFTVFPSKMEGFGLPIIESLWHQRPVICGRNGAIGEVASDGGCHQIDQNNPAELADSILRLLTDKAFYQRLYQEADQRVFRNWTDYGRNLETALLPP